MCSKAPRPDPNIGAAAASSAEVAKDALAWNKQIYEEGKPQAQAEWELAQKFANTAMDSQKTNDALAQSYADRMKETFYPVENKMVAEASDAGGAGDQEEYANLARGANESALQAQNQQNTRTLQGLGINPNSGSNLAMLNTQAIQNAAIQGNAMNQARMAARQLGWAKKSDVANLGRGLPSSQATSAQVALGASGTGLSAGIQPIQAGAMRQGAMNQGFGTALQGYNQQGNLGLGVYQGKLNAYGQQMELMGSIAGAAGSLGAAGLGAMKFSDRRLKKNIVLVGKTAHDLNLYEFEYLWGTVRHEGVMADEVMSVMPSAVLTGVDGYMKVDYSMLGLEFK